MPEPRPETEPSTTLSYASRPCLMCMTSPLSLTP